MNDPCELRRGGLRLLRRMRSILPRRDRPCGHRRPIVEPMEPRVLLDAAPAVGFTGDATGGIEGEVWFDANQDGMRDPGDLPLPGWTVFLDLDGSGGLDPTEPEHVTDADGAYAFTDLADDTYTVRLVLPADWTQTLPGAPGTHVVAIAGGATESELDFAAHAAPGAIEGAKWFDLNRNGVRDPVEGGVAGVTVFLDLDGSGSPDAGEPSAVTVLDDPGTTQVDESGTYALTDLPPRPYTVAEVLPIGVPPWEQTFPAGGIHLVDLQPGETRPGIDFGNLQRSEIQGLLWEDLDANGALDGGEPPLSGWTVFLDDDGDGRLDGGEINTVTGAAGDYRFENLLAATYTVAEVVPLGWVQTAPGGPAGRVVALGPGQVADAVNFGNAQAQIFGTVFDDQDRNESLDAGEAGLAGWTVSLDLLDDGSIDDVVVTDPEGNYGFLQVPPGLHAVELTLQAPWVQTFPAAPPTHAVDVPAGTILEDPFHFGVFHPPDLFVSDLPVTAAGLGEMLPMPFIVDLQGPGVLGPNDQWIEQLWLTDDGLADGQGYELLIGEQTFTDAGARSVMAAMPSLGDEPGTVGGGVVTLQMLRDGLQVVVVIDAPNDVVESDDDNNTAVADASWKLPDLVVDATNAPRVGITPGDPAPALILPEAISYTVRNAGTADIPDGVAWIEQVWLGTDENVHLPSDPGRGAWYHRIETIPVAGSLAADATAVRAVTVPAGPIVLPKEVSVVDLKWIVMLDWPDDGQGVPLVAAQADPAAVLETHEIDPATPTNNRYAESAFERVRRLGGTNNSYAISTDGRFVAVDAVDSATGFSVFVIDRDADEDGIFDESHAGATAQIPVFAQSFGENPQGRGGDPSISADGRYVAYTRFEDFSTENLFRFDLDTAQTIPISVNSAGAPGEGRSFTSAISGDGDRVVFGSTADNLVQGANLDRRFPPDDPRHPFGATDETWTHTFVHDVSQGRTVRTPIDPWWSGFDADQAPVISVPDPGPSVSDPGAMTLIIHDERDSDFVGNWVTDYPGEQRTFRVILRPSPGWKYFNLSVSVPPIMQWTGADEDTPTAITHRLARVDVQHVQRLALRQLRRGDGRLEHSRHQSARAGGHDRPERRSARHRSEPHRRHRSRRAGPGRVRDRHLGDGRRVRLGRREQRVLRPARSARRRRAEGADPRLAAGAADEPHAVDLHGRPARGPAVQRRFVVVGAGAPALRAWRVVR
ncbi:MAG: hypothetical protein CMJ18_04055 [Phycisphaeraceae bacterium]|nr:hypothetical protein [Phycisphaeraceae bacterium]